MMYYRTAGPWGPGVGANLAAEQVDGNFYDVASRVRFLELNPGVPIQITSFTSAGNLMYINMSDGTVHGPVILPSVRWRTRGEWQPNTVYSVDDVVVGPDSATYLVVFSHTSGPSFSPGANDGAGHDFYSLLLKVPSLAIPSGGGMGTVLTKNTDNNYDMVWRESGTLPGGSAGMVLQKNTGVDGDASWQFLSIDQMYDVAYFLPLRDGDYLRWSTTYNQWVNQARPMLNVLTASSWAPVVGDEGSFMVFTNGPASATIMIPNDSTQNFQVGSELHVHQDGTGPVAITGESGVTLLKHAAYSNKLLGQYATATVKKTAANVWRLFGLLAGA